MSERLPNGLTVEQDAAMGGLAFAIADHLTDPEPCPGCCWHSLEATPHPANPGDPEPPA